MSDVAGETGGDAALVAFPWRGQVQQPAQDSGELPGAGGFGGQENCKKLSDCTSPASPAA